MPANTQPIYSKVGDIAWSSSQPITAANTTRDMTSGTVYTIWTADATNGGFLQKLRFIVDPNVSGGVSAATVARIWINNGSTTGTAANNSLFGNLTLPAVTPSATVANNEFEYPFNVAFPAGYKVCVTIHTATTTTGWFCNAVAGKY